MLSRVERILCLYISGLSLMLVILFIQLLDLFMKQTYNEHDFLVIQEKQIHKGVIYCFLIIIVVIFIMYLDNIIYSQMVHQIDIIHALENELELIEEYKRSIHFPLHLKEVAIRSLFKKNNKCSICLEKFTKQKHIFITICGHIFHKNCIQECIKFSNKCPYCRDIIK